MVAGSNPARGTVILYPTRPSPHAVRAFFYPRVEPRNGAAANGPSCAGRLMHRFAAGRPPACTAQAAATPPCTGAPSRLQTHTRAPKCAWTREYSAHVSTPRIQFSGHYQMCGNRRRVQACTAVAAAGTATSCTRRSAKWGPPARRSRVRAAAGTETDAGGSSTGAACGG